MQFNYVLDYRDEAVAAAARFPGEPPRPATTRSRGAVAAAVACAALAVLLVFLISRDAARGGTASVALRRALVEADRNTHPVFVSGIVVAAVGGGMCVCPVAYAFAIRRARRPLHDRPVSMSLADTGLRLRSPDKELFIDWSGVVAVMELPTVFVLKTVGDLRLVLPKRACGETPEEVRVVADELRKRVTPLAAIAAQEQWGVAA